MINDEISMLARKQKESPVVSVSKATHAQVGNKYDNSLNLKTTAENAEKLALAADMLAKTQDELLYLHTYDCLPEEKAATPLVHLGKVENLHVGDTHNNSTNIEESVVSQVGLPMKQGEEEYISSAMLAVQQRDSLFCKPNSSLKVKKLANQQASQASGPSTIQAQFVHVEQAEKVRVTILNSNQELTDFHQFAQEIKEKINSFRVRGAPPFLLSDSFINRNFEVTQSAQLIDKTNNGLDLLSSAIKANQKGIEKHAIIGNGGVGKSWLAIRYFTLAREKANKNQDTYHLSIWANETTIFSIFYELAEWTGYKISTNVPPKIWVNEVYRRLLAVSGLKILLIIDDVQTPSQQISSLTQATIQDFLPGSELANSHSLLHIIITSRWREWRQDIKTLSLGIFSKNEAIACLENLLPLDGTAEEKEVIYRKLANQVKYLPFALSLVASYIKLLGGEVKEAIDQFINQYDKFYKQDLFTFGNNISNSQKQTIANLWMLTLKQLEQSKEYSAVSALCCLSYLEGSYIDKQLCAKLLNIPSPPRGMNVDHYYKMKLKNYLEPLLKYSLIEEINEPTLFEEKNANLKAYKPGLRLHTLLQEALRLWQESIFENQEEAEAHLNFLKKINIADKVGIQWSNTLDKLKNIFESSNVFESYISLFPHLSFLLSNTFADITYNYSETKQAVIMSFTTKVSDLYVRTLAEQHVKRAEDTIVKMESTSSHLPNSQINNEIKENESLKEINNRLLQISALRAGVSGLSLRLNLDNPSTNTKIFQLPERKYFVGRQDQLLILHNNLSKRNACLITQAIQGFGGIGKTRLAIEYIHQFRNKYDYISWFDTEANFIAQIKSLIRELNSDEIPENLNLSQYMQKLFQLTKYKPTNEEETENVVKEYANCLWVFDNVDNSNMLQGCLPPNDYEASCHIIITSRQQIWQNMHTVFLHGFTKEEGYEYIEKHLGEQSKVLMLNLLVYINFLPLALAHAVAYIQQGHASLKDYPEHFSKHQIKTYESGDKTLDTVRTSVTLSLEGLRKNHPHALCTLQACVGLAPDDIPFILLEYLFQSNSSLFNLNNNLIDKLDAEVIDVLLRYSLIEKKDILEGHIVFSIHRLVMEVLKDILDKQKLQEQLSQWAKIFIDILNYDDRDNEKVSLAKLVAIHAQTCQALMPEEDILKTELICQIGYHYEYTVAEPAIAQSCFEQVLSIFQDEEKKSIMLNHLGNTYGDSGNRQRKIKLLEEALDIQVKKYGNKHPFIAITKINLANSYGGNEEEENQKSKLLSEALEIQETVLGKGHWQTAGTMDNLAMSSCFLGFLAKQQNINNNIDVYLEKAKKLWRKAIAIKKDYYGDNHYSTAVTLGNYGGYFYVKGKYPIALSAWQESLRIKEQWYGKSHWMLISNIINMANAYAMLKDSENQKNCLEKALPIQEKHDLEGYEESKRILLQIHKKPKKLGNVVSENKYYFDSEAQDLIKFPISRLSSSVQASNLFRHQKSYSIPKNYYSAKKIVTLLRLQLINSFNIEKPVCLEIIKRENASKSQYTLFVNLIQKGFSENCPSLIPVLTFSSFSSQWIGVLLLPISENKYRILFVNSHGNGANSDIEISKLDSSTLINKVRMCCSKKARPYWQHIVFIKELIENAYYDLYVKPRYEIIVTGFIQLNKWDENDMGAYLTQNFVDIVSSKFSIPDFFSHDILRCYKEEELREKHSNLLNSINGEKISTAATLKPRQ